MSPKFLPFFRKYFYFNFILVSSLSLNAIELENVWTPLYKGVDYRFLVKNDNIKIHQIRINNNDSDIDIFVTAPLKDGISTEALKPSTFLSQKKAQIVINGSGYSPSNLTPEGVEKICRSLAIYKGKQYAKNEKENAAFVVLKDGKKKIIKMDELPTYKKDISMAMGAWDYGGMKGLLIDNGEISLSTPKKDYEIKARSAIGISEDGGTLYLVVVEGKPRHQSIFKEFVSASFSMFELAQVMQELGCPRAMTLDAGGSSTLVVENILNNQPLVLNVPSDHKGERAVGSHIGIKAKRIESDEQLKIFRKLQENTALFDLLHRSETALNEIYMNKNDLTQLDHDDITPLDQLYERFGVSPYVDSVLNYNEQFEKNGKTFQQCFVKEDKYGLYCENPKILLKKLGIENDNYRIKADDLHYVQEKQGTIKTGSTLAQIYRDTNKIFYFVQSPKSIRNELIGSKLMSLILGPERTADVKIIEDRPEMIAARMIKGFQLKRDLSGKNVIGSADLDIAMDFLGLTNRSGFNIGHIEVNSKTLTPARVDYSYSFLYEEKDLHSNSDTQDPLDLRLLFSTFKKHSRAEILPTLKKIAEMGDEQIFVEVLRCWTVLSEYNNLSFSLKDAFKLASNLLERKELFAKVLSEIKNHQHNKYRIDVSKLKSKEKKWIEKIKEKRKKFSETLSKNGN
ncbi:MAG: hypothetical protein C5B43_00300 [Verrucomicrobia bacterium]|nr:MAG: hypothetical protein C5B43_00300 [Verrucomicrobiota bacterium]